ncbi:sortase family protein [Clostridium argentinense CDC 2741]|uniref:Sortase family protein n=1 Tax=Clostridium argentinense CDC 2741 TaxID=1418104 RepID=A0A0C1U4Q3_9CLOT|nr:class D sortase [Clostridium argentinense]ARC86240.1 sortase [Clostridium argentinense]KIE47754.1 sortase family protein [Clostridium argentinense CDC 2741]NFF41179.1 class D sortase [Clostridium argentinense]NFP51808.1 class D sortase [Clostridium argentinense]NFP73893.1 class D sortase [Clostridium argentinense]
MKNKVFRVLGIVLLVIGILMVGYGIYNKVKTNNKQKEMMENFESALNHIKDSNNETTKENKKQEDKKEEIPLTDDVIAIMEIPKIKLQVAVKEGTEMDILNYAVGHFKNTAMPGKKGNFAVAGHRNYTTGEFFLNVHKLTDKDEIKVRTHENTYIYTVSGMEVVNEDALEVLNPTEDATITLVTCTEDGKQRLIVRGKLKE